MKNPLIEKENSVFTLIDFFEAIGYACFLNCFILRFERVFKGTCISTRPDSVQNQKNLFAFAFSTTVKNGR